MLSSSHLLSSGADGRVDRGCRLRGNGAGLCRVLITPIGRRTLRDRLRIHTHSGRP